jgi:large subunit ribosomal protein L35
MPKMKTHKGTAKRFKLTGSGKIKRANAFKSHILEKKSPKRKRGFAADSLVHKADTAVIRKNLGV